MATTEKKMTGKAKERSPYWWRDEDGQWHYDPSGDREGLDPTEDESEALENYRKEGVDRSVKEGETSKEAFERIQGERKDRRGDRSDLIKKQYGKDYRKKVLPQLPKEDRERVKQLRGKQTDVRSQRFALKNRLSELDEQIAAATDADAKAKLETERTEASEKRTSLKEKTTKYEEKKDKLTKDRNAKRRGLVDDSFIREERDMEPVEPPETDIVLKGEKERKRRHDVPDALEDARKSDTYKKAKRRLKKGANKTTRFNT